jgi:hypothetical protein
VLGLQAGPEAHVGQVHVVREPGIVGGIYRDGVHGEQSAVLARGDDPLEPPMRAR